MTVVHIQPDNVQEQSIHKPPKRRPKKPMRLAVILAAIAFAVAAFGVLGWLFGDKEPEEDAGLTYIGDLPVTTSFLPEGSASRPGVLRDIKYVVIHETDNFSEGAGAAAHGAFLLNHADTQELSWHYTVDDHEIYHHLPDNEAAFHASDHLDKNGGNLNGIGVELCVNADGEYENTLLNGALLTATLLHEYNLSIRDVKQHRDFSGKICPARLIEDDRWEEFLAYVERDLKTLEAQADAARDKNR